MYKRILLILFLVLFAFGFGITGAGLCYSAHTQEKTCSATTEGRVIECRKIPYFGQKRMFTPVVEYQVGNEMFTGESDVRSSHRAFETGESVTIGYNPENPEEFYIKSYDLNIMTRLGILFLVISGAVLAITGIVLILARNNISKEKRAKLQAGIIVGGIVLVIVAVFTAVAGLKNTLCILVGMGLFALYGWFHNKRRLS